MSITQNYIKELQECLDELSQQADKIEVIADMIYCAFKSNKQIFIVGNGGSASTASHCPLGFEKQSAVEGKPRIRAKSLGDNIATITALANDIDYSSIFKEQLINQLDKDDIVIGISVSGKSPNVLQAIEYAKNNGAKTISFTGFGGGKLGELTDECIALSSSDFGQVEDVHLTLTHILSNILKDRIANG